MEYPHTLQFNVEKIFGNQEVQITLYSGLTILVGTNASGKTQTLKKIRDIMKRKLGGDKVRYLSSNRIGNMEQYRSKTNQYSYTIDDYTLGDQATKRARLQIETASGDFFAMDERKDVFIKVSERLSVLFNRNIFIRWDAGHMKVFFGKTDSEQEYSVAAEASGLVNVILRRGAVESYYAFSPNTTFNGKPSAAANEVSYWEEKSNEQIYAQFSDIVRSLQFAALDKTVDESFAVKKELLSELALILGILPQVSTEKELLSCIKQAKGSAESLFDYRIINDSKRLGVEVSLKSEIIDVDGFPFKAFVGDNVNILIDERIQSHLSEESQ